MRQGPIYSMRGEIKDGKLIFNIPLELIDDFEDKEIIVNWRDDHSNVFTVIIVDDI